MKEALYYLVCYFMLTMITGCGSGTPSQPVGTDVMQKYSLEVEGQPTTTPLLLPQVLTDEEWTEKNGLCREAGYDLTPYAGSEVSVTKYDLKQMYNTNFTILASTTDSHGIEVIHSATALSLYLLVISKDQATICSYVSAREDIFFLQLLHTGQLASGLFPVNDQNIK